MDTIKRHDYEENINRREFLKRTTGIATGVIASLKTTRMTKIDQRIL